MKQVSQSKGLSSIPDYVRKKLTPDIISLLESDGHGISFPDSSGCQMRLVRNRKDLGGFYSYKMYGGTLKAIKAAISRHQQLRIAKPLSREAANGNVSWYEKLDKRCNAVSYGYQVFYRSPEGKLRNKTFGFGYRRPSPNRQLHAFRTAKLFRYFYEVYGPEFDQSIFKNWKHVRLYQLDQADFDWNQDNEK